MAVTDGIFEGVADVFIDAGSGVDSIAINIAWSPRTLSVLLGAGKDVANIFIGPSSASNMPSQIVVHGGTENDQIAVDVTVPQANSGIWDVQVLGRTGDDTLSLFVHGSPQDLAKSGFLIDGGAWRMVKKLKRGFG